ncbi:hypothetical protein EJB05_49710, partial [Eragrostis curvula]
MAINRLTDDMLAEIILKLPVKSVARSQCVARNWRATISDEHFRRRLPLHMSVMYFPDDPVGHIWGKKVKERFACASAGGMLEDFDMSFFPFRDRADIQDACNGLLLFSLGAAQLFVVDPVTRRWEALSNDTLFSVLAYDPSTSPQYYVVNFFGCRAYAAREVFSSETRAWATYDVNSLYDAAFNCGQTNFHDGSVYLLGADSDTAVRVDIAGGEATVLDLPEPLRMHHESRLGHYGGRLHYMTEDRGQRLINVWVHEEDQSSWRLKYAVEVDDVVAKAGGCREGDKVSFVALHPEKDAAYLWLPPKVVEYDLARKEVTGAWELASKADHKNPVVLNAWLVPSSRYLSGTSFSLF